ncbi:hypothetical protein JR064_15200 [Xanthomonas sp. CFBP 8703]|uniref:Uncharacterized protein n=1 Tax=Xanthomonas bonasiae TaxID=2810351 RepID=A0ABS3B647_9XANT|nr:hypothetical protein [Xanthomonas bonasiae]MBN6103514.1 hypothetical protein [Xanthomonas bonasiae]
MYGRFGALIGNNDMPLGNAGALLADTRPLALAPSYDMLPMALRPAASGEVVERDYTLALPTPEYRDDWRAARRWRWSSGSVSCRPQPFLQTCAVWRRAHWRNSRERCSAAADIDVTRRH